ncbi:hypothetical protein LNN31_18960 [Acetobacterium wieringae]|uniref:Type II toxin-antitoxin system HicA family toxin n=1 Tax=Acetobacterium wieringae TaxID=52694 RepID=A0ABY6HET9_9FIRM|nr:hypothetical protein [Acetobacterium wieringae]UYO62820.1 hypothetical protein LNN31_18960 [Acetobacterium wieringae]
MKSYTIQAVIEILEKKGFSIEEPENNGILHCVAPGYKEIKMKTDGVTHYFKVLTNYTTNLGKALEWAGVEDLEDVA